MSSMRVESGQNKFLFVVQAAEVVDAVLVLVARSRMGFGKTQGGCELRVQDHAARPSLDQIRDWRNSEFRHSRRTYEDVGDTVTHNVTLPQSRRQDVRRRELCVT